jgi:hypothetical protein
MLESLRDQANDALADPQEPDGPTVPATPPRASWSWNAGSSGADDGDSDPGSSSGSDESTSAADTSTGSTGDPGTSGAPSSGGMDEPCGDGVVDPQTEECDGDDPRCNDCLLDRVVFVTSIAHHADFGGLAQADEFCNNMARGGRTPLITADEGRTMRAWLSGPGYHAGTRFTRGKGRYVRPDGLVVSQTGDHLTSGNLLHPISVDETGTERDVLVWTNTSADGAAVSADAHCGDWTDASWFQSSYLGWSAAKDFQWSRLSSPLNPSLCGNQAHLYCIEEGETL